MRLWLRWCWTDSVKGKQLSDNHCFFYTVSNCDTQIPPTTVVVVAVLDKCDPPCQKRQKKNRFWGQFFVGVSAVFSSSSSPALHRCCCWFQHGKWFNSRSECSFNCCWTSKHCWYNSITDFQLSKTNGSHFWPMRVPFSETPQKFVFGDIFCLCCWCGRCCHCCSSLFLLLLSIPTRQLVQQSQRMPFQLLMNEQTLLVQFYHWFWFVKYNSVCGQLCSLAQICGFCCIWRCCFWFRLLLVLFSNL